VKGAGGWGDRAHGSRRGGGGGTRDEGKEMVHEHEERKGK